ncbi:hypothetical protein H920_06309 [Fukomys damarensis]|uniref:Uncharacterized protein n=1 Tax=Fukomys damarensis TaxID=885580 RepID=A0A091DMP2_FUKDA|nr:hypothetical protein H920_06309 [Fukomys damarensis]
MEAATGAAATNADGPAKKALAFSQVARCHQCPTAGEPIRRESLGALRLPPERENAASSVMYSSSGFFTLPLWNYLKNFPDIEPTVWDKEIQSLSNFHWCRCGEDHMDSMYSLSLHAVKHSTINVFSFRKLTEAFLRENPLMSGVPQLQGHIDPLLPTANQVRDHTVFTYSLLTQDFLERIQPPVVLLESKGKERMKMVIVDEAQSRIAAIKRSLKKKVRKDNPSTHTGTVPFRSVRQRLSDFCSSPSGKAGCAPTAEVQPSG